MEIDKSIEKFTRQPDDYRVYVKSGKVYAEKKGFWTFIKAKLFFRDRYKIDHVAQLVSNIIKSENQGSLSTGFVRALNAKVVVWLKKRNISISEESSLAKERALFKRPGAKRGTKNLM